MKVELKKKLLAKTGKVKCVDFHPSFNWVLLGLYNGSISIFDYLSQASVQCMEVTTQPIRAAKFLVQKNYIICGADDKKIRVYNYNTMEKITEFEAHTDFIRSIVCHIKLPMFLSSSDDNTIKLWDVENNFKEIRTYNEHKDFVMKLATNPKDYNMFASGSTDKKIKIWSFNSINSQLTLEGHNKGVNTIAFCNLPDKPYLASGGDDFIVKIWDYTNKNCLFTLTGHELNMSAVCFHPELPLLLTAAEDQFCKIWNITTGKLEDTKIFGYDIIWDIAVQPENNFVGFGCDDATLVVQMGNEEPLVTFNHLQSKIIYSQQNNIFSLNLKQVNHESKEGDLITIPAKQLGTSEVFPNKIMYSPNGRYFAILSDRDYIISTSGVYRSSAVGSCYDLAWNDGDSFITKEGSTVKLYNNLKEERSFKPGFSFDGVFGGPLFGVRTEDSIFLYDIENTIFIRKIDVCPNKLIWNEKKTKLALICEDVMYILDVNYDKIEEYIEKISDGEEGDQDGCQEAFGDAFDVDEKVLNGFFYEDVFVYETAKNKINYAIKEKIFNITTLSNRFYLLGYLESTNKIYLMNKNFQLISYSFPVAFINYQIEILHENFEKAGELLKKIPENFNDKIISFLEKFNLSELSFEITKNPNQKFSLALKLKKLNDAYNLAKEANNSEKLKMVSDLAIELGEFNFAEKTMKEAKDYSGLLLYYSTIQNRDNILQLAKDAKENGLFNVAFSAFYELNDVEECLNILLLSKRFPEAATFSRTYCPSKLDNIINSWNQLLEDEEKNNRLNTTIKTCINEDNKNLINNCEKIIDDFYEKVKESDDLGDYEGFNKFLEYDLYKNIKEGNNVNLEDIIKVDEDEEEEESDGDN